MGLDDPPAHERAGSRPRSRRSRNLDRAIGILLGLVLGIAIVTAFVFLGSEDTIDAPRIETRAAPQAGSGDPAELPARESQEAPNR